MRGIEIALENHFAATGAFGPQRIGPVVFAIKNVLNARGDV